ncbi:MAG: aminotransferase class V-fold PLP-dependent enzyme [Crocinitomicaceae bacterium]|nr:aminotransferase class V-fold PLP-dependent enzyme [Crocinitomicaceae bacterium]
MEHYFANFGKHIIGNNDTMKTPYHDSIRIVYADWTASGRMYQPIEDRVLKKVLPYVANTHTDTNYTGSKTTYAYSKARQIIKDHVGANEKDVLVSGCSGMTGVVNKFQRILGLKIQESFRDMIHIDENDKPIVFVTHMEHHSNQTSWLETIADVVVVNPDSEGLVCLSNFEKAFEQYANRSRKIAAITSCSNVTGIVTPYMDVAEIAHKHGGLCFVDFACSAPYIGINMHEDDESGRFLDAIYFSPHKFLGGPGTSGILVFNRALYTNEIPDNPGGGTVDWTNPWGGHKYTDDIEAREDGGTPAFIQTIRAAMCMQLKDQMGVENIAKREEEIIDILWDRFDQLDNVHLLAGEHKNRLGVISFYIDDLHFNLGVKILNDRYGVQTRGGCSCAGTYGHFLFDLSQERSNAIMHEVASGVCTQKPGWIRMSIHPTMSNEEVNYIMDSIEGLAKNHIEWSKDYTVHPISSAVQFKDEKFAMDVKQEVDDCFELAFA